MRHILALFDAPIPASRALAALAEVGFTPADVAVVPPLPGTGWSPAASFAPLPSVDEAALVEALTVLGIPPDDARAHAEGVRRGGILIAVRAPTLSAPVAAAALQSAAPPDLAAHRARWAADPDLRYGWAAIPPPLLDAPPPPAPLSPPSGSGEPTASEPHPLSSDELDRSSQ